MTTLAKSLRALTVAGAGVLVPATNAFALWDDRLELFASETVARDNNVFRLSSAVDPTAALGTSSKADTYQITSFGLGFDVPVSRQRFVGGYARNYTRYNRFTVLDLDGYEGRALWFWQIGNELNGQVGYTERLTLASLANVQSGLQSVTPDFLKTREAFFNAAYKLTARWQIRGQANWLDQSNSASGRKVNDTSVDTGGVTVSYITPANNQIGINVTVADANVPTRELVAALAVDNSYRQQYLGAVTEWTLAGHSRVDLRAGRVTRDYAQLPQRNYAGPFFFAGYEWKPTGKLTFNAVAQRDISSTEEINTGFVVIKRIALSPTWQATEKISVDVVFEHSDRDYRGDPGQVLGTVGPRTETVRAASLGVSYRPLRTVTVNLAARRETRTASVAFGDYAANIVSLGVRLGI